MSNDPVYYFTASPEAAEVIETYFKEVEEAQKQTLALKERMGAKGFYHRGSRVVGLMFEEGEEPTDPKLMRRDREIPDMWVPAARYKKGKALRDELAECKAGPDGFTLTSRLFEGPFVLIRPNARGHGMVSPSVGIEKLNDQWVICVPWHKDPETCPVPMGSAPMKRSEFWALKEAEEEASASAAGA